MKYVITPPSATTSRWLGRATLIAFCVAAATSFAEDAPPAAAADATAGQPAVMEPGSQASEISPAQQRARATQYLTEINTIKRRVRQLASRAREQKDLIKLNCLNDKLLQIRGSQRLAEQSDGQLTDAIRRGDDEGRHHEFSKLTIIYQKVTVLGQEAEACVGDEISYVGETQVTVEIDPTVEGQGDPTEVPPDPLPAVRPPIASPTQ